LRHPEQILQTEIAGYLRGHLVPPAFFTAIGHGSRGGGFDGFLRGVIAKDMGVKRNLPDLYFRRPRFPYDTAWPTWWIELKVEGRPVPDSQLEFHEVLRSWGDTVAVCRSLDAVKQQLTEWGFTLSVEKLSTEAVRRGWLKPQDWPESSDLGRRKRRVKT
jgi:hypothetical protein